MNGKASDVEVESRTLLVHCLRDNLGLTGTRIGCDTSTCGACTVLIDGQSVKSCTVFAFQAQEHEVTTVEGLRIEGGDHPLQRALHEHHALQCGFCTSGVLMAAASIIAEKPTLTDEGVRRALKGNLCRCTGYQGIVEAIMSVDRDDT
ncbi:(2Fe-2S)-binding protein [Nocardioides sp.]|uniref:(2Fe-2S)-binding protein n=1 Tax=Nocardioides sp. TaxID=35761 RepID=UPI003784729E